MLRITRFQAVVLVGLASCLTTRATAGFVSAVSDTSGTTVSIGPYGTSTLSVSEIFSSLTPTSTITFTTDGYAFQAPDLFEFSITNLLGATMGDISFTGSGSDGSTIGPIDILLFTPIPDGGTGFIGIFFDGIDNPKPNVTYTLTSTPTFIPEPNTIVLLSIGLLGLGAIDVCRRMRVEGSSHTLRREEKGTHRFFGGLGNLR